MKKYILKVKNNDLIEEKEFFSEAEAIQELEGYKNNRCNGCAYVALIDVNKNLIIRMLCFSNRKCLDVRDGSVVKLQKEYCEQMERNNIYIVTNINENNESCLIPCINSGLPIPSAETVDIKMIEVVTVGN